METTGTGQGQGQSQGQEGNNNQDQDDQFQISVSARFKPRGYDSGPVGSKRKISLPLHQRMALIKMNRKISSQTEAFKVLVQQGGWFGNTNKPEDTDADSAAPDETRDDGTVKETKDEQRGGWSQPVEVPSLAGGVHLVDTKHNFAVLVDRTKGLRKFDFDHVVGDTSTQKHVYDTTTMPLIAEFINGYNATCLVYGQTGSGKTYSMFGPHVHEEDSLFVRVEQTTTTTSLGPGSMSMPDSWGVVPRAVAEIFEAVEYRQEHLGLNITAEIGVSYIEIYGNDVSDLLKEGEICGQSKVAAQRYVLDGSSEVQVTSLDETLALLDKGEKQKRKAATAMNARSSRAHTLFIVTLRQECVDTGVSSTSRLFLADLGGSEQIKRSQPFRKGSTVADAKMEKQRVREAVNINLGLLALKQCVEALRKKKHVPYGDSKLTMMLSTGLGGDSKTAVIVCGAQEESHGPETIAAMHFGMNCRGISNTVKTNANMLQSLLQNIDNGIAECEQKIKDSERWEEVDDPHNDADGNLIEMRKKTVVVGADEYRLELANLIRQKAELTGDNVEDLYGDNSGAVAGFGDFHKYTGTALNRPKKANDECTIS